MRRDGDGWVETAADDAAMAVQLAPGSRCSSSPTIYTVLRAIILCAIASTHASQPIPQAIHASSLSAGWVARLYAKVFKPTPLHTLSASVGGPSSTRSTCSSRSSITICLRSRWIVTVEAGGCREYVHHVALPRPVAFPLSPAFFPQGFS
jgi:hypothetical protein